MYLTLEISSITVGAQNLQCAEKHEVAQAMVEDLFIERTVAAGRCEIFLYECVADVGGEAGAGLPEERHEVIFDGAATASLEIDEIGRSFVNHDVA